jgi:hypothetical protein
MIKYFIVVLEQRMFETSIYEACISTSRYNNYMLEVGEIFCILYITAKHKKRKHQNGFCTIATIKLL